jgi:flagellar hook protein FlgE
VMGFAGDDMTSVIYSGALEGSNVDISEEFTNMIITQRGFQASARVITLADELLTELINLKR